MNALLAKIALNPKAVAALARFVKVLLLGSALLAVNGALTMVTANALDLAPNYQSFVMLVGVPILAAAQKWLTWETTQPYSTYQQGIH
jgi:hypothetical protein